MMNTKLKRFLSLLAFLVPVTVARGQVDIDSKMKSMKKNVGAATYNFDKNRENLQTSAANVKELTRVLNELGKLRIEGQKGLKLSSSNIDELSQAKKKYQAFLNEEFKFIKSEMQNIEKLKRITKKILINIGRRKKNVKTYQSFIKKIDVKLEEWDGKKRKVASLVSMVESKAKNTDSERKSWLDKTRLYKAETSKWAKQKKISGVNYKMFNKLRGKKR